MRRSRAGNSTWGLVLAGGDGTRLRALTRAIVGRPIPKQYCRILGDRSMLEITLARIAPLVRCERTLAIVNRDHLELAEPQLAGLPSANRIVQPENRDTGPGMLLSLLEVVRRDPQATLAVFPSDHYVADDDAFRGHLRAAARVVDRFPERIALLGIEPDHAESGYGYVEPSEPLGPPPVHGAFRVSSFREKPSAETARELVRRGWLWNSMVMLFRAARMLALIEAHRPADVQRMAELLRTGGPLAAGYARVPRWNLSSDLLSHIPGELVVLRATGTGWSDWGTQDAIERTLDGLRIAPPWRGRRSLAATA